MKRLILIALGTLIIAGCSKENNKSTKPEFLEEDGLEVATFKEAGIDSMKIMALTNDVLPGSYNLHSLLIARNNKLVSESYYPGKDEFFGDTLGFVLHYRDSVHDCRSITKSVVSACIGIAIDKGHLKNVDEKVFDIFPEYARYNTDAKKDLTVKDLLTMSAGLQWNEEISYADTANSERQMMSRKDPVAYVLSRPMIEAPGSLWTYSGGCTQTLAAIIRKVTGQEADAFANENIFKPLGISKWLWFKRQDSVLWAASGLRLRSRDIMKFGLLYMNDGRWNGKQIISSPWVNESVQTHIVYNPAKQNGYGYQFWTFVDSLNLKPTATAEAIGLGGQRIFMNKELDLLVVMTAGNYNLKTQSDDLFRMYILPAVRVDGAKN